MAISEIRSLYRDENDLFRPVKLGEEPAQTTKIEG